MGAPRSACVLGAALVLAAVLPPAAHARISQPPADSVVRGIVAVTEDQGGESGVSGSGNRNTRIEIFNAAGGLVAQVDKGSHGPLTIQWVTANHPNGAYRIRSRGVFCKRRVFGSCVENEWRTIDEIWVTVENIAQITYSGPTAGTWDDTVTASALLTDATTGWALPNRSVRFQIGDRTAAAVTDASGQATADLRIGGSGTTTASATFDGDAFYVGSSSSVPFVVEPVASAMRLDGPFEGTWGDEVAIRATLQKASPRSGGLGERTVTVSLGPRSRTVTTSPGGEATAVFLLDMPAGEYPLSATFAGDPQVIESSASGTFGSQRRATTLAYRGVTQIPTEEEAELIADLTDAAGGEGVWGEVVRFEVGGLDTQAVTDIDGRARVTMATALPPGTYDLSARFDATGTYVGSQTGTSLLVVRRPAHAALTVADTVRWQDELPVSVELTDLLTGVGIAEQPVMISLGSESRTVTTDGSGRAATIVNATDTPGPYAITAEFDGDAVHEPASAVRAIEILRRPVRVEPALQIVADDPEDTAGEPWVTVGATVVDGATAAPVPGQVVTITAGAQELPVVAGEDGRAEATFPVSQPKGLSDLVAASAGDAFYLGGSGRSVFAVGWDAYTDAAGAGAVFLDVDSKRVRAIVPLIDPTEDTGEFPAPITERIEANGDRVLVVGEDDGSAVSGIFNRDDATFSAAVDRPSGSWSLGRNANVPPSADAGGDLVVREGEPVTFSGAVSDPDEERLFAWWDFGDGTSAEGVEATHVFALETDDDAAYTATLTVRDGAGARVRDSVRVTVEADRNRPPVLDPIGDHAVEAMKALAFEIAASDPEGDPITLSHSTLPAGAQFDDRGDGTGRFTWRPDSTQAGSYEVTFEAADDSGDPRNVASEMIVITVLDAARRAVGASGLEYQTIQEALDDPAAGMEVRALPGVGAHTESLVLRREGVTLCGAADADGTACIGDRDQATAVVLGAQAGPTLLIRAPDAQVKGLTLDRYERGIVVEEARATVFHVRLARGRVGLEIAAPVDGTRMRESACSLDTPVCVRVANGITGRVVDARLNDWSVYVDPLVERRAEPGGSTVVQKPYLGPGL